MARVAQLIPDDDYTSYKVFTPDYSEGFREAMNKLPAQHRNWDSEERCWMVDSDWREEVERLIKRYYPDATIEVQD